MVLHPVAVTTPVHNHERYSGGGHHPRHVGVSQTPADVVDDGGTRLDGLRRNRGPHGVHRDPGPSPGELTNHRDDAVQLFFPDRSVGAGAGGLTPPTQDVSALLQQVKSVSHRRTSGEPHPAVAGPSGVRSVGPYQSTTHWTLSERPS